MGKHINEKEFTKYLGVFVEDYGDFETESAFMILKKSSEPKFCYQKHFLIFFILFRKT